VDTAFLQYGALGAITLILMTLFVGMTRLGLRFGLSTVAGMREDVHAMIQVNEKSNHQFIEFLMEQGRQNTAAWNEVTTAVREVGVQSARGYEQLSVAVSGLSLKVQHMPSQRALDDIVREINALKTASDPRRGIHA